MTIEPDERLDSRPEPPPYPIPDDKFHVILASLQSKRGSNQITVLDSEKLHQRFEQIAGGFIFRQKFVNSRIPPNKRCKRVEKLVRQAQRAKTRDERKKKHWTRKVINTLGELEWSDYFSLATRLPEIGTVKDDELSASSFRDVDMARLAAVAEDYCARISDFKTRRGKRENWAIHWLVVQLASIYECLMGRKAAAHYSENYPDEKGGRWTPFVIFVAAFLRAIGSEVAEFKNLGRISEIALTEFRSAIQK